MPKIKKNKIEQCTKIFIYRDLNAPCLPPSPKILHNHLFPFFIGYCSRFMVYVKMVNWRMYKKKLYKKKKTTMSKPITFIKELSVKKER